MVLHYIECATGKMQVQFTFDVVSSLTTLQNLACLQNQLFEGSEFYILLEAEGL